MIAFCSSVFSRTWWRRPWGVRPRGGGAREEASIPPGRARPAGSGGVSRRRRRAAASGRSRGRRRRRRRRPSGRRRGDRGRRRPGRRRRAGGRRRSPGPARASGPAWAPASRPRGPACPGRWTRRRPAVRPLRARGLRARLVAALPPGLRRPAAGRRRRSAAGGRARGPGAATGGCARAAALGAGLGLREVGAHLDAVAGAAVGLGARGRPVAGMRTSTASAPIRVAGGAAWSRASTA